MKIKLHEPVLTESDRALNNMEFTAQFLERSAKSEVLSKSFKLEMLAWACKLREAIVELAPEPKVS